MPRRLLPSLLAAPAGAGGPGVDEEIEAFVARSLLRVRHEHRTAGSLRTGGRIGACFAPDVPDMSLVDAIEQVGNEEAVEFEAIFDATRLPLPAGGTR